MKKSPQEIVRRTSGRDTDYNAQSFDWTVTPQTGVYVFQPVIGATDPAGSGNDTIYAGAGDDYVWAGAGDDVVYGEDGNDQLAGNAGSDFLSGGAGDDNMLSLVRERSEAANDDEGRVAA